MVLLELTETCEIGGEENHTTRQHEKETHSAMKEHNAFRRTTGLASITSSSTRHSARHGLKNFLRERPRLGEHDPAAAKQAISFVLRDGSAIGRHAHESVVAIAEK